MDVRIETSIKEDGILFKRLLMQPDVLQYFPMHNVREIDDSVRIWEYFQSKGASLTALVDNTRCGLAFMNLQGYKKIAHQCIITIIVEEAYRGKRVGTALLEELFIQAREKFSLEMVHLEVYESNPAINLYKRLGFKIYGVNKDYIKEGSSYIDKILMERWLIPPPKG